MNRALITLSVAVGTLTFGSGIAMADAHEDGFKVIPVDMYACTYNEGKGPEDLDDYAKKFNAWADKKDMDYVSVWTLTPYYYGPGDHSNFEFIWMIAAKTAVAMGKTHETWLSDNDGLAELANEIATCAGHVNYASINYKPTPEGRTPEDSLITFSDCNYREDASFEALGAAMDTWAEHLGENGSEAGIFHWYPAYGGGGEKFDFKWLEVHAGFEAMGADYEHFGNGRGYKKYNESVRPLITCDSARVYQAKSRRFTQLR